MSRSWRSCVVDTATKRNRTGSLKIKIWKKIVARGVEIFRKLFLVIQKNAHFRLMTFVNLESLDESIKEMNEKSCSTF
jgi:hypothetical protein